MVFPLPFPIVELSRGWSGADVVVLSSPVPKRAQLVRLLLRPAGLTWTWPWGKGWRRHWWGKTRTRKRAPFRPDGFVTGITVAAQPLLAVDAIPWELFGPTSFDARLTAPTLLPGMQIELRMSGRGLFTACALVESYG